MSTPLSISETLDVALASRQLYQSDFLYIHTTTLFRTRMTPERILKNYEFKCSVQSSHDNAKRIRAFSKALRTSTFTPAQISVDVRYAYILRDNREIEIVTAFLDHSNRSLLLNGVIYGVQGELVTWFKEFASALVKLS